MPADNKDKITEYMDKVIGDLLRHKERNEWRGDYIYPRKMSLREKEESRRFWNNGKTN
jgi:hemerythrin superfamily protein